MAQTNGSVFAEAARVFGAATRQYEKLEVERNVLLGRLAELDGVLAQLPSEAPAEAPKQGPGRPRRTTAPAAAAFAATPGPKAAAPAKPAPGKGAPKTKQAAGGRTFREILTELLTKKPSTYPEIVAAVVAERPDINPKHVSPMVSQLKKTGVVKTTGEARSFIYSLA